MDILSTFHRIFSTWPQTFFYTSLMGIIVTWKWFVDSLIYEGRKYVKCTQCTQHGIWVHQKRLFYTLRCIISPTATWRNYSHLTKRRDTLRSAASSLFIEEEIFLPKASINSHHRISRTNHKMVRNMFAHILIQ